MKQHIEDLMMEARKRVRQYYINEDIAQPDHDGMVNIEVSYDGTWMTRGHKSHIGIGFVMEVTTGTVIDMEVLCNHCRTCNQQEKNKEEVKEHKCQRNYNGKSGAMEAEAAVRMWCRSTDYQLQYVTLVSDGDASTYKTLCSLNNGSGPYNVQLVKEECINHVSKRMGTRPRKLKKDASTEYTTRTGRKMRRSLLGGVHMLTDDVIDHLSRYYGKAIRNNVGKSIEDMKRDIWASFFHLSATDKYPSHQLCPPGSDSWCFYNRAKADNVTPEDHKSKNLYLARIPFEKLELIKTVYRDLTGKELLQRCQRGRTQNPNESLHSKIWSKCNKNKYAGLNRVRFVASVTILEHNFGKKAHLLTKMYGTDEYIINSLETQEAVSNKSRTPKQQQKKKRVSVSEEYQAGNF